MGKPILCVQQHRADRKRGRGRRVIEPDVDPVTFLAAGLLWLLMMPNNLGWKN